jgi:hypothetical protein
VDETFYYNCGDWVESHTALVENHDGTFEIINWADMASNNEFEEKLEMWSEKNINATWDIQIFIGDHEYTIVVTVKDEGDKETE